MLLTTLCMLAAQPAFAQEGSVLTSLQSQITTAAKGWETTVMDAAKSLFWILATIEIGIAAVWLAIQAASLDSWFAELVRRIMFVGFFAWNAGLVMGGVARVSQVQLLQTFVTLGLSAVINGEHVGPSTIAVAALVVAIVAAGRNARITQKVPAG